jgi:hypothetical protein
MKQALLTMVMALPLAATPVLTVGGTGDTAGLMFDDQARSAQFRLTQPLSGVSIFATTTCSACSAVAYLTTRIGSSFNAATDTIAFVGLPSSGAIFTNLNLAANTYYLTLVNRDGLLSWTATVQPMVTMALGAEAGFNYRANTLTTPVIGSTFEIIARTDRYHFRLEATAPTGQVPEPSAALLLAIPMAVVIWRQKGQKGR